jgi:hypothetical protein
MNLHREAVCLLVNSCEMRVLSRACIGSDFEGNDGFNTEAGGGACDGACCGGEVGTRLGSELGGEGLVTDSTVGHGVPGARQSTNTDLLKWIDNLVRREYEPCARELQIPFTTGNYFCLGVYFLPIPCPRPCEQTG